MHIKPYTNLRLSKDNTLAEHELSSNLKRSLKHRDHEQYTHELHDEAQSELDANEAELLDEDTLIELRSYPDFLKYHSPEISSIEDVDDIIGSKFNLTQFHSDSDDDVE